MSLTAMRMKRSELIMETCVDGVVTIDDSARWIIDKPVLVAGGTTLKIGPEQ